MQSITRSTDAVHGATVTSSFASIPMRVSNWLSRRRDVSRAIRELSLHSDRELADLGVSRGDIVALANGRSRQD